MATTSNKEVIDRLCMESIIIHLYFKHSCPYGITGLKTKTSFSVVISENMTMKFGADNYPIQQAVI